MERKTTRPTEKVFNLGTATFVLDPSYSELKVLGQGSYGVVVSAQSERLHKKVAIKKVTPVAKHVVDAKHVLREVRLLRHMGKHENIITLEDLIYREAQDELYIVMELMDTDLHQVIQSKQPLTEQHFQHFMYQLLCGLKYLHDNRIIHRDLKPGNLLVSRDCRLRITDFGLSRERPRGAGEHQDDDIDEPMTQHVVTRWYRPPELMLCPDGLYTYAVDIWSVGCIFAEMLGRNPLFPGKNFIHQLMLVFDVIGSPMPHETRHIVNPEARKFLSSQASKPKVSFAKLYPSASSDAWWLLDQMLIFDADKRITVNDALDCRYFGQCARQLPSSAVYPPVSPEFEFNFERENLTRTQLKQLVAKETLSFKREKQRERLGSAGTSAAGTAPSSSAAVDPPRAANSEEEAKPTAKRSASVGTAIARQQQQQQQQQEAVAKAMQPDATASAKGKAPTATATGSRVARRPAASGDDDAKAEDDSSSAAGRKASVMANYLKNTAASNTRSHSTSRLRPSHTTTSTAATSTAAANAKDPFQTAKPTRPSATITARDVLREMMEPDAYDFLDLHTQRELQHVKKDPSTAATATATAAAPPSPKKLAPRPSDATVPPGQRASSVVKDVEDSLVAKLSKAQIIAPAASSGGGASTAKAAAAIQNTATRDMISETIAAVLNSPRRQAKVTAALPVPVSPAAKPVAPPVAGAVVVAAATETTLGTPTRRKSLMETYSSPKRLAPSHVAATSPAAGPTTAAATAAAVPASDAWARKSERWEKLQAEIKQQQDAHAHYAATAAASASASAAARGDGYDSAEEKERNFLRKSAALRQSQQLQKQLDEANAAPAPEAVGSTLRQSHSKVPLVPLAAATAQPPPPQPPRQTRYHGAHSSSDDDGDNGSRRYRGGGHLGRLDSARGHGDGGGSTTARTLATQASTVVAAHDSGADRYRTAQQPPRRHSSGGSSGGGTSASRLTAQRSATYTGTRDEDTATASTAATAAHGLGLSKEATTAAAAAAAADGPSAEKKRKLTVPKSPKFSTMSWQRRRDAAPRDASSGAGAGGGGGTQGFEDEYLGISTKPTTAPTATAKARAVSTSRAMSRHF